MKRLNQIITLCVLALAIMAAPADAQTINIGPNQYAFQFTGNPNFGMYFNAADTRYELRDGSAAPVFQVGSTTGDTYVKGKFSVGLDNPVVDFTVFDRISNFGNFGGFAEFDQDGDLKFVNSADYLVGSDRFAFRFEGNENFGLFFNAAAGAYQFLDGVDDGSGKGSPVFSVDASTGDVTFTGTITGDGSGLTGIGTGSETDPIFTASPASGISAGDITNWNTAFGWGDHSTQGYLTSESQTLSFNPVSNVLSIAGGNNVDLSVLDGSTSDGDWNVTGSNMHAAVSGNVGIGITAPSARLHVIGAENNGSTASFKITNGSTSMLFDGNEIDGTGGLFLNNNSSSNVLMGIGASDVGVGTTSPGAKLHVNESGTANTQTVVMALSSSTSDRPVLQFSESTATNLSAGFSIEYNGAGSGAENKLQINRIGGAPVMTFKDDATIFTQGNFGINKENADLKLDVVETSSIPVAAARIEGAFDATAYLAAQGKTDYDGISSLDISGSEIGLLGVSVGSSTADNYGVYGHSNGSGAKFEHSTTSNSAEFASSTHAAELNGKTIITGGSDASAIGDGYLQLGEESGLNVVFDDNEIIARNNGSFDDLHLQADGGNVVIGSGASASGYELSVNGDIMCESLRVQDSGSWPDYVFENNYKLMSLQELEASIKANKHLPGVPSAAVVEKEGYVINDMNKIMMQKIEELTLYILKQDKQIKELQKSVSE